MISIKPGPTLQPFLGVILAMAHFWILLFGGGVHLHGLFRHDHSGEGRHGHLVVVHAHHVQETAGVTAISAPDDRREHRHDVALLRVNASARPAESGRNAIPDRPGIDPAPVAGPEAADEAPRSSIIHSDQKSPPSSPGIRTGFAGRAPPAA